MRPIELPNLTEFHLIVILGGIDINEGETFSATDLKNDLTEASAGLSDFDLIDMFDDDNNKAKIYAGKNLYQR